MSTSPAVIKKFPDIEAIFFKYFMNDQSRDAPYFYALAVIGICTLICRMMHSYLADSNLIMVYLMGVTIVALRGRTWPSMLASVMSVLMYDFFFVPDFFTFSVTDIQYVMTLVIMLLVGQIISHLIINVRRSIEATHAARQEIEKERFRNTMLTSVSHDLRTPLTAIMGSASSILQSGSRLSANDQQELIQNIYDQSERLNRLVSNILKIIKLESGTIRLSRQPCSLEELLTDVLAKLSRQLLGKPVNVKFDGHAQDVALDHLLIEQVFVNLIENAIKFTPVVAPIDITVEYKKDHVLATVADHGPGIREEDAERIFDKFYRPNRADDSGLGLGLAICKGIIEEHQGKIWAEPREKCGAVFKFIIPYHQQAE